MQGASTAVASMGPPLILSRQSELGHLVHVENVATLGTVELPTPGAWSRLVEARHIEEADLMPRLAGKTAGEGAPVWHAGHGGAPAFGVHVCRVASAYYAPEFGAVITRGGVVLHSSVAEALYLTPTLLALPGAAASNDGVSLTLPTDIAQLRSATVFLPWGGRFNYGHFLLDALPALAAVRETGLLATHPPVTPLLNPWQRELLQLYLGEDAYQPVETPARVLEIGDVVFASPMDHFLHAPNRIMVEVRDAILTNIKTGPTRMSRLYLSRRKDEKRRLINEVTLEEAMRLRGFTIVFPADYSVVEQISLFRDADIIVAPTGAALANVLFCKANAKIFEIQPTNFVGIWVRAISHLVGANWFGFFAPSPRTETEICIEDVRRSGVLFDWELNVEQFLAFFDIHVGPPS